MLYVLVAFLISLIITLLLVRFNSLHRRYTADHDITSVQKYHVRPVPRVGGMAIVVAMFGICVLVAFRERSQMADLLTLLLVAMPAFLGGLAEDVTKHVRVLVRLGLAMISGGAAYYFCGAMLTRLDIIGVDWLLQFGQSLICTMIAIAAANAINIIDGYNGLAAVISAMIFAGFSYVSYYLGDRLLLITSVGMIGAIVISGMELSERLDFSWRWWCIFYRVHDWCCLSINAGSTSRSIRLVSIAAMHISGFETLFSIYRKRFLRGQSRACLMACICMLIYKRLVRWAIGSSDARHKIQRNAMTSPYLWLLTSFAVIPAVLFWQNEYLLMFSWPHSPQCT